jgi:hypothetical protein
MVNLRRRVLRLERKEVIQDRWNKARAEIARRETESAERLAAYRLSQEQETVETEETGNVP